MIDEYFRLWKRTRNAFSTDSVWQRATRLGTGSLLCLGRHSVTGLITSTGKQDNDWSADYRLFERERFDEESLFSVVRDELMRRRRAGEPLVVMMDDTLFRKKGKKVSGTGWKRDPNGPKFCNNFIWSTRYLQISGALEEEDRIGSCRGVPLLIRHCPTPKKPSRKAPQSVHDEYAFLREGSKISSRGAEAIRELRGNMDKSLAGAERQLVVSVDGGYTNRTVITALPERTTLIGRIRKDAKIYSLPGEEARRKGRKRFYGAELPTPEELRQDDSIPWETVKAFASDREHEFNVKRIGPIRSRIGSERNLSLLIIRPLHYRLKKGSCLLYRKPTYLVCTDTELPAEKVLQWYLWRWQIEVNFRDEKSLIGINEASVRTEESQRSLPMLVAASYAFMQLAFTGESQGKKSYCLPKWRKKRPPDRLTTGLMVSELRKMIWGLGIGSGNLSHFANRQGSGAKCLKFKPDLASAVYYAHR